jgi:hypothetical protein
MSLTLRLLRARPAEVFALQFAARKTRGGMQGKQQWQWSLLPADVSTAGGSPSLDKLPHASPAEVYETLAARGGVRGRHQWLSS